jgi:AcrR family transcriptional regulator
MPKPTFFNLPEAKRDRILDLALDEFANNDFESASISRIVARAGIAKGSLYQYFEDKADLYLYLIETGRRRKGEHMAGRALSNPAMGLFDTLRWLMREMVTFELANPRLAKLAARAMNEPPSLRDRVMIPAQADTRRFFEQLVRQGIDRGDLRPDLDPQIAAFVFGAIFTQLADYLAAQEAPRARAASQSKKTQRALEQVMALLEQGMRADRKGNPS